MPFIHISVTEGGFTSSSPATSVRSASGTADDADVVDRDRGRLDKGAPGPHAAQYPGRELGDVPVRGRDPARPALRPPRGHRLRTRRRPALVMAHGFTATMSGMVAERYAERLHASGLQVLLFDHRGFGLSGGFPRRQVIVARPVATATRSLPRTATGRRSGPHRDLGGQLQRRRRHLRRGLRHPRPRTGHPGSLLPRADAAPSTGGDFKALLDGLRHRRAGVLACACGRSGAGRLTGSGSPAEPAGSAHGLPLVRRMRRRPETGWSNEASVVELDTHPALHAQLCSPHRVCPSLWVVADDEMPRRQPCGHPGGLWIGARTEGAAEDRRGALRPPLPRDGHLRPRGQRTGALPGCTPRSGRVGRPTARTTN